MTSDRASPIAAISAAMLAVFAATRRKTSARTSQRGARLHHIGGEPLAGHPADPRTHQLNCDHERRCQKHGPEQAVAKLRAGLRIGGDARRVVIGGAGHQSRAEQPKHHPPGLSEFRSLSSGHECLRGARSTGSMNSVAGHSRFSAGNQGNPRFAWAPDPAPFASRP